MVAGNMYTASHYNKKTKNKEKTKKKHFTSLIKNNKYN
jgi:hypothetical protein